MANDVLSSESSAFDEVIWLKKQKRFSLRQKRPWVYNCLTFCCYDFSAFYSLEDKISKFCFFDGVHYFPFQFFINYAFSSFLNAAFDVNGFGLMWKAFLSVSEFNFCGERAHICIEIKPFPHAV